MIWVFDISNHALILLPGHLMVPAPNDLVRGLLREPRDVPYELYLRGNPEKTKPVIIAEAEAVENEASQ